jgi:hypothetical protein
MSCVVSLTTIILKFKIRWGGKYYHPAFDETRFILTINTSWTHSAEISLSGSYASMKNGQRRYKYIVLGRDRFFFVKKPHSDSTKKFSETDIINMLDFFIDNIFVILVDVFFNTVGIPWVQTVLLFWPTCSFIRMRQTSYRGFSRNTKRI